MHISNDPVFRIAVMFFLTQILGLSAGIFLLDAAAVDEQVQMISVSPTGNAEDPINGFFYVGYILLGAAMALILIKFIRWKLSFRFLELFVVAGSTSVLLFAFIYALSGAGFIPSFLFGIAGGILFALAKFFFSRLKNIAAILSSSGVGALFGFSMGFIPAVIFIIGVSIYDYLAVFKTKHMLCLAQNMGTKDMSFTVTASKGREVQKKHTIKNSKISSDTKHVKTKKSSSIGFERIDLGSGDLAVPAMLSVSTFSATGLFGAIAVLIGTTISIYYTLKYVERNRVILPALPPICLGGMLALLIYELITGLIL
jgi:presenilin-like A22 family membrane protease